MTYTVKAIAIIATFFGVAWQSVRLTLYVGSLIPAGDYQKLLKVVWYIASVPLLGGVTFAVSLIAAVIVGKLIGADKE
jgi:hypothetical protein